MGNQYCHCYLILAGTHWTNEMARMLLKGKAETVPTFKPHLEFASDEELEQMASPRVINAHTRMSEASDDVRKKKIKIIFTLRDPKDVAVSLYKLMMSGPWYEIPYKGSFSDYLHLFLAGNGKSVSFHFYILLHNKTWLIFFSFSYLALRVSCTC